MKTKLFNIKSKAALVLASIVSTPAMATGGGFSKATEVANGIKVELYAFLGVCAFIYMMFLVGRAKMGKAQWSDVLEGLGHVAIGGGILVAVTWAWNIFA